MKQWSFLKLKLSSINKAYFVTNNALTTLLKCHDIAATLMKVLATLNPGRNTSPRHQSGDIYSRAVRAIRILFL